MFDGYGLYKENTDGGSCLEKTDPGDERECYEICEGCTCIGPGAFAGSHYLKELRIPASVRNICEGALSNSGSWAEREKGLEKVIIDKNNKNYIADEHGVFELTDHEKKLILYLRDVKKDDNTVVIPSDVISVGDKAFYGKHIEKVIFEKNGFSYSFPKHAFFNEELLKRFGKNGRLYDFEEYDNFLLRDHFNADRIRMTCERITQDWEITPNIKEKLKRHISDALGEALETLAFENAAEELRMMAEAGFFTEENILGAIDVLNRSDRREMLTYLMDYRNSNLKTADFDFSI